MGWSTVRTGKPTIKTKVVLLLAKHLLCVNIDCGSHVYLCGLVTLSVLGFVKVWLLGVTVRFHHDMASLLQTTVRHMLWSKQTASGVLWLTAVCVCVGIKLFYFFLLGKYDPKLVGYYTQWNNLREIALWNSTAARRLDGTGGYMFHPNIKRGDILRAFVTELFR